MPKPILPSVRSTVPENLCSWMPMRVSNGSRRHSILVMWSSIQSFFPLSFLPFFPLKFFFISVIVLSLAV
ncbi:hypothetical protein BDV34DRAFT_184018 [Aspergillus parasiticus]|uniref:Uncharacterized protein n=1 Tax=Aspergillus parasiticus TaxID=5067 RepID=A0A5N6E5M8_ASPPA|nr:hypothetical protein BDV34DRAFT_184018 [Aspergillus parasiticus]